MHLSSHPTRRLVDRDMTMRYHWGLAVGHLHTYTHREVAPISTSATFGDLRHELHTVEQGADGGKESPDKDEDEIPDTASDVHDGIHWDQEDMGDRDHEGSENFEYDSDSDSQHSHTASETESEVLELDAMYGDSLDVEWTSFD
jgi:hypothetical protein